MALAYYWLHNEYTKYTNVQKRQFLNKMAHGTRNHDDLQFQDCPLSTCTSVTLFKIPIVLQNTLYFRPCVEVHVTAPLSVEHHWK